MKCFKCGYENPDGARFCINCGSRLKLICPKCGADVPLNSDYCPFCGHKLFSKENGITDLLDDRNRDVINFQGNQRERKNIAVMFADISNFTSLSTELDPEELQEVISDYFSVMTPVVHKYDGYIDKFIGDSIMALFGAPIAHEDAPMRAVLCGIELIDKINQYNKRSIYKRSLSIGIDYGLVATGKLSEFGRYTAMGEVVNLAKRLESSAKTGEVLVSKSVYNETRKQILYGEPMQINVKGFSRTVFAYKPVRIVKMASERNIHAVPFVGREKEMNKLLSVFKKVKFGQGNALKIVGEPGVGKSKLAFEFANRVEQNSTVIKVRGIDYLRDSPYRLIKEMLRNIFKLPSNIEPSEWVDIIEQQIYNWSKKNVDKGNVTKRAVPFIKYLLNLPMGEEEGNRFESMRPRDRVTLINDTISDFLLYLAEPVNTFVIIIDDIQWGDMLSISFFNDLYKKIKQAKIMLLYTSRIKENIIADSMKSDDKISLFPLNIRESEVLTCKLLNCDKIDKKSATTIYRVTEGNPFYIEEFVNVMKKGELIKFKNGIATISKTRGITIPNHLKEIILTRVDKIDTELKTLLRFASVLGDEFSLNILSTIFGNTEMVRAYLNLLIKEEFLKKIDGNSGKKDTDIFRFKHVITKDVIYDSILKRERKIFHKRAAMAYERIHENNLAPYYDIIAFHYIKAGLEMKSFDYLKLSAKHLHEMNNNKAAIEKYKECLKIKTDPDVYFALGTIYETIGNNEEALSIYDEILNSTDEFHAHVLAMYRKASLFEILSKYDESLKLLNEANNEINKQKMTKKTELEKARNYALESWILRISGDINKAMKKIMQAVRIIDKYDGKKGEWSAEELSIKREVLNNLGVLYIWIGQYEKSLGIFNRILGLSRKIKNKRVIVSAYNNIALVYENLGKFDLALKYYKRNMRVEKKLGNKSGIANIYGNMGRVFGQMAKYKKSILYFKKYLKISQELNNKKNIGVAYGNLGVSYQGMGNYRKAIECFKQYLAISEKIGNRLGVGIASVNYAEVYYEMDEFNEAKKWFIRGKKIIESADLKYYLIAIYRGLFRIEMLNAENGDRKALEVAEAYADRLEKTSNEIGVDEGIAHSLIAKGMLLHFKERVKINNADIKDEVKNYFERAIGILEKGNDEKLLAEALVDYGTILQKSNEKYADRYFNRAKNIFRELHLEKRVKKIDDLLLK